MADSNSEISAESSDNAVPSKSASQLEEETKMTTHNELIRLGGIIALRKSKIEENQKTKNKVRELLNKYENIENSRLKKDEIMIEFSDIIENFKKYMKIIDNEDIENKKEINSLKESQGVFDAELEQVCKETDEREVYWGDRVSSLRSKCISRNKAIFWYRIIICLSNLLTWYVTLYGFSGIVIAIHFRYMLFENFTLFLFFFF